MAVKNRFYINAKGDVPAADFAYTMSPTGAGAEGSVAVPWVKTGLGGANLPAEIRKLVYGTADKFTGYDPFANATGYAIDPNTGQVIIRQGEGGASYVGAFVPGVGTGKSVEMDYSSLDGEEMDADTGDVASADVDANGKVVSTYVDPATGDVTAVFEHGVKKVLAKSGAESAAKKSAYDLLYQEFNNLGIGGLVPELKSFIEEGIAPAEFTLRLRQTDSYKKRFAANAQRINKGLRALSEAEYIRLEDEYQDVMRRYGLPESYYKRGEMGRQEGFEKFIAGDVSSSEVEERISTAQKRVINANPEVAQALKAFYPGISQGDILAYTLDPSKAIEDIKRKVTAAEIGGAAMQAGLTAGVTRAEELGAAGITKQQAQQGFQTVAEVAPRGGQLAAMYGESPYTQQTAEQEVFGLAGSVDAAKQRKKLVGLERAEFSGQSGAAQGALGRERAGNF